MKLSNSFPSFAVRKEDFGSQRTFSGIQKLTRVINNMRKEIVKVVNHNAVEFVSQNDQPTPSSGQMMVWEDADATAGNPTHYIVYNDGTNTVTFASEETV